MFWRIMKKDLKRKKTMNIILLLFVILSSMFASASVNNIAAITKGLDGYVKASGITNGLVVTNVQEDVESYIMDIPGVRSVYTEKNLMALGSELFLYKGKKMTNFINVARFISDDNMGINYFDTDDRVITGIQPGHFYANVHFTTDIEMAVGDTVTLVTDTTELTLIYDGRMKDLVLGGTSDTSPRLLINAGDFHLLEKDPQLNTVLNDRFIFVDTDDVEAVKNSLQGTQSIYVLDSRKDMMSSYIYDMMLAIIMLMMSVLLMLASFGVIRFSVSFSISEEFREIGVMKAVGMDNRSIRLLYMTKYLAIALIGGVTGVFAAIPLNRLMMKVVTKNIVLAGTSNGVMGLVSVGVITTLILLFCYGSTRKINKLSAIDAVRNGQTGERFGRKTLLHLGKSRLPATGFLAVNDILSAPKQFITIAFIFALTLLGITQLSIMSSTLKGDSISLLMSVPKHDLSIGSMDSFDKIFIYENAADEMIADIKNTLAEHGIGARVTTTFGAQLETAHGDKNQKVEYLVTKGAPADCLEYDEGSAPMKNNEVAVTDRVLKDMDAQIGDTLTVTIDDKKYQLIITGVFSTFMGGGNCAYLSEDWVLPPKYINNIMGIQVKFDEKPDEETRNEYKRLLMTILETNKIYTPGEMMDSVIKLSDKMKSMEIMMDLLTVVMVTMITVLMERSFIAREKNEIALMKALGVKSGSIVMQHTLRFVIVSLVACLIALAVTLPLGIPVFTAAAGSTGSIRSCTIEFDPADIFVLSPLLVLVPTTAGSFLTALYTRSITASDAASIE